MINITAKGLDSPEGQNYFDTEEVQTLYHINVGDVILFNNTESDTYSNLQKDVQKVRGTKYELTHSALGWNDLDMPNITTVDQQIYEAKEAMTVTFWDEKVYSQTEELWIYRFKNVPQKVLDRVTYSVKRKTDGAQYGFLQIIWFEREAFYKRNFIGKLLYPLMKKFHGDKNLERWGNQFPSGFICSELVFMQFVGIAYEMNWTDFKAELDMYDQNNVSPVHLLKIIEKFPQYISLIHSKILQDWRKKL